MLTTNSTTTPNNGSCSTAAHTTTALSIAIDDARMSLAAALGDLHTLMAAGTLGAGEAQGLEAEYIEVYLARVAAIEQLGGLACTPDDWQDYEARAARRNAAKARRDRLRDALRARQCLVVMPGRVHDSALSALVADEPDGELLEIRGELAAAQLL